MYSYWEAWWGARRRREDINTVELLSSSIASQSLMQTLTRFLLLISLSFCLTEVRPVNHYSLNKLTIMIPRESLPTHGSRWGNHPSTPERGTSAASERIFWSGNSRRKFSRILNIKHYVSTRKVNVYILKVECSISSVLDKDQVDNLLTFLEENNFLEQKLSQAVPTPKPQLTHVRVRNIDEDIARNLALYGNPLGIIKTQPNRMAGSNYQKTWIEK